MHTSWRAFQLLWLFFIPDLFGKLFLITFNFSLFDFSTIFLQEKYFSIFNNKPPASWVVHITRDSFTCHSCSCYSSMKTLFIWKTKHIYAKTFTVFESTLKKHCHIGQFLKFYLRQQLFAKKDFYAKSRLCYIFKTTDTEIWIKAILESPDKLLQMPWKITALQQLIHFSQAVHLLATFYV